MKVCMNQTEPDFQQRLFSQWQRGDKSVIYLIYRWLIAIFFAFSVVVSVVTNIKRNIFHTYFIYLTHLNLCGTLVTTTLGAIQVHLYYTGRFQTNKEMTTTLKVYWVLWNQSFVMSILVSIFYWVLIYKGQPIYTIDICDHITNFVVLFFDLFAVKHPPKCSNFVYLIFVELVYTIFTIIYQIMGGLDK